MITIIILALSIIIGYNLAQFCCDIKDMISDRIEVIDGKIYKTENVSDDE